MSKLVHVSKIEKIYTDQLSSMKIVERTKCLFQSQPIFEEISVNELVDAVCEDSLENNEKVFTTTISFQTCDKTTSLLRRMAFRLTCLDGKKFMVGTNHRPFPIIKENNPYPGKPTESALKKITITWKSPYPMLEIVEI